MKPLRLLVLILMFSLPFAMPVLAGQFEDRMKAQADNSVTFYTSQGYLDQIAQIDCLRIQAHYEKLKELIEYHIKLKPNSNSTNLMNQVYIRDFQAAMSETRKVMKNKECTEIENKSVYEKREKGVRSFSDTPASSLPPEQDATNKEKFRGLLKNATDGDATAQRKLANMYYQGRDIPEDYVEAVKWYRKAADQGNAQAQAYLGNMYYYGRGVTQNYAEAINWYHKAAEQGNTDAQYSLGIVYSNDHGVPQDYVEAYKWFNLAATLSLDKSERDEANRNRDIATTLMSPAQIAEAQKRTREWKPKK
jgi:hypothetical protein